MEAFYAHTATTMLGGPDPDESRWQLLRDHLFNVAQQAGRKAVPFGLSNEAVVAGLLHDLGKYAERFQARLRNPAITGINHLAHGTELAYSLSPLAAFAIDGHHTGIPSAADLQQTLRKLKADPQPVTGYPEQLATLRNRLLTDAIKLPGVGTTRRDRFAEAMRVRFLFSSLVDADYLDTEQHFDPERTALRQSGAFDFSHAEEVLLNFLNSKSDSSSINKLRKQLLEDCL